MRFSSTLVFALSALAVAEEQAPLADKVKGWFNKAQSYVSSAVPAPSHLIDAGAAKVASAVVSPINRENWKTVIRPTSALSEGPEEWVVYVTGGNTTCFGRCANATKAWNESVALMSPNPKRPNFAILDCEEDPILCNAWAVGPPALYYILLPKPLPDQSKPSTTVYYIPMNRTSITAREITKLVAEKGYQDFKPYEGPYHPFDGLLAQFGLDIPLAYVSWGFSKLPSWAPMIIISFLSRSFMGRRMNPNRGAGTAGAAPAGAAPAR
ncbi:hypothetical protein EJ05DRAFT_536640 [Pseudovirgaria hyperparasitica]|uniref:Uncharacterized protein n=1 Tax=Pseudovirgaria hyperparasitica TaxID=470096 RepID=A0A6A6WHC0_9PEZI|nr:uncharacterized protein EJ05DRAFT_536640 [Pseudovirgaria hyperparasitica]KAF2760551.1 hypothetical protein EJ05DRAFT_536640 [Pseudovirgaria hyperparasitica]